MITKSGKLLTHIRIIGLKIKLCVICVWWTKGEFTCFQQTATNTIKLQHQQTLTF